MNCYRDGLVLLSIAMAYRRVGEFFSQRATVEGIMMIVRHVP